MSIFPSTGLLDGASVTQGKELHGKGLARSRRDLEELEASRDLSWDSQEGREGVSGEIINCVDLCTEQSQTVMAEVGLAN